MRRLCHFEKQAYVSTLHAWKRLNVWAHISVHISVKALTGFLYASFKFEVRTGTSRPTWNYTVYNLRIPISHRSPAANLHHM